MEKTLERIEQRGRRRRLLTELVGLVQAAVPMILSYIRKGMARDDLLVAKGSVRPAVVASGYVSGKRTCVVARNLPAKPSARDWKASPDAMGKR